MFSEYEAKQLIFEKETKSKVINRKTKKRDDSTFIKIDDAFKKFYAESSNRKKILDKKLASCLSIPHISINVFTHPFLIDFANQLDSRYQMPTSFHGLRSLLSRSAVGVKTKLQGYLKETFPPSLTIDLWSDRGCNNSYLGVTIHFIRCANGNEFRQFSAFLGAKLMELKNGITIREETEEMLEEYGLNIEKVFKIVTDNGSNVVKAYEGRNILQRTEFWLDESEYAETHPNALEDHDYFGETEDDDDINLEFAFPKRLPCAAHILENALQNSLKGDMPMEGFRLLRNLIGRFNRSVEAKNELKKYAPNKFISPSNTRWGYWIDVVERFLEIEKGVRKEAEKKGWPFPTFEQINFLRDILPVLMPIKQILHEIQGEKNVSISNIFIYIKMIKSSLDDGEKKANRDSKLVIQCLKNELLKRFNSLCDYSSKDFDPIYLIATCLDPNNAKFLNEQELVLGISYIASLIQINTEQIDVESNEPTSFGGNLLENLKAKYLQERTRNMSGEISTNSLVNEAVKIVLEASTPIDPIIFWGMIKKDLIPIRNLAFSVLAIPCTAAPIERVWSKAGSATQGHRAATGSTLLNDQLFIYVNKFTNLDLFSS